MSDDAVVTPAALAGERLDRAVALLTGWSRADVVTLIEAGAVLVGARPAGKSRRLAEGDMIEIKGQPEAPSPPAPEEVPFAVVYEDADVVVISKPPGIVVHPGAGQRSGTLAAGLLHRFPDIAGVGGDPMRPGIVHRLDRDTSGLMVVARTDRSHTTLVAALAARIVERRYLALAWGRFDSPAGTIDAPIGRSARYRTRMAVREAGRPAVTHYQVLAAFEHPVATLLECRLETGRTHQIRVHLAAISRPVAGDAAYGGMRGGLPAPLPRPFLHATALAFAHPTTGERLAFTDPLPADLQVVLSTLEE